MSVEYFRPASVEEALRLRAERPGALFLAGGTFLRAAAREGTTYLALGSVLPGGVARSGRTWTIGAGTIFQDLIDAAETPQALRASAAWMASRNIRNRATLGGNLGADKSCSSLLPFLLAAEARLSCADGKERSVEEWRTVSDSAARLVLSVSFDLPPDRLYSCAKYSRTASDLAVLTCAASAELVDGYLRAARVAMGGLGPKAVRLPALERALEGLDMRDKASAKDAASAAALPFLTARSDLRGSADFKRVRAATLLADVLASLEAQP